jgi:hypothetical protein
MKFTPRFLWRSLCTDEFATAVASPHLRTAAIKSLDRRARRLGICAGAMALGMMVMVFDRNFAAACFAMAAALSYAVSAQLQCDAHLLHVLGLLQSRGLGGSGAASPPIPTTPAPTPPDARVGAPGMQQLQGQDN